MQLSVDGLKILRISEQFMIDSFSIRENWINKFNQLEKTGSIHVFYLAGDLIIKIHFRN